MAASSPASRPARFPSAEQVLAFLNAAPAAAGKREIARHFGLKGSDKIALKQLLKQMAEDGKLARKTRRYSDAAGLPAICTVEVVKADRDGELIGEPVDWDVGQGEKPRVLVKLKDSDGAPARGDRLVVKLTPSGARTLPYTGTLVRRLSDRTARILGIYRVAKGRPARIVPVDKKARRELMVPAGDDNGARDGELVEAEIIRDRGMGLAAARVRERLGDMDDQRNVSLIAIHAHGIPHEFPAAILAETARLKPFSRTGREDLRDVPLITIDPADARDHDDAVWAEPDADPGNPGGVRIVVAIADVAAYVTAGSALDAHARRRGNSVYFPDRVVPMLPERISNDLCSLIEGEERPALACFMTFSAEGRKTSHRFARALIRSEAKLAYEEAQDAIEGRGSAKAAPLLEPVLKPLWAAYGVLERGRRNREPLDLDLPERKIILDDAGRILRVTVPRRLDAHRLIEEFMIQANVAAAEELEKRKSALLYRAHEPPDSERVAALAVFLATLGIKLAQGQTLKPRDFNRILKAVAGTDHQHLVNEVVLRTQSQAAYAVENRGHFGLNLQRYAHFTSPIRRYADLVVHRALLGELSGEDVAQLKDTADLISAAERRAMAAERETLDRLVAHHLAGQIGATFHGRIGGVTRSGLFIKLDDTGADGFVPAGSLGTDYFGHDEARHALVGSRSGETYRLGDRVEVRLLEAAPVTGGLRFEMVSDGRKGAAPAAGRGKPARPARRR